MDYPFNQIVLDIVELLQDLKAQGMEYIFSINASGSVDIWLFADKESYKAWAESKGEKLDSWYIMPDDTTAAHMCWNDLMSHRENVPFDLEAAIGKAEFTEER